MDIKYRLYPYPVLAYFNDDYIDSDYIERFLNLIIEENSDVAIGGFKRVNEDGKILYKKKLFKNK